ncbi:MAG TPA: CHASE domain-containing protein, partial [Chromatiaceae bacterium]|nr:CHASE domain-containing protein [Chromatiaceae bacterium]
MPYYARIAALYRHQATAWVMLMLGLMVTALAWFLTDRAVTVKAQERFGFQSADLSQAIQRRLLEYETILRGGVGFFEASSEVTREEWRRYVASLRLHQIFPGIQGLGFTLLMPAAEVADHEARVRAEGFPDYAIRPPGRPGPHQRHRLSGALRLAQPARLRLRHVLRARAPGGHDPGAGKRRTRPQRQGDPGPGDRPGGAARLSHVCAP